MHARGSSALLRSLARYGAYAPLFLLPGIILSLEISSYPFDSGIFDISWELVCLFVSLLGVALRLWTAGVSPRGRKGAGARSGQRRFFPEGPYSLVRHPKLLANALILKGVIGFAHSPALAFGLTLMLVLYLDWAAAREVPRLARRYREEFRAWARQTPAFLPSLAHYRPPRHFDEWRALRKEVLSICAVFAVFFLMDSVEDLVWLGDVEIDPAWTPPLVISALLAAAVHLGDRSLPGVAPVAPNDLVIAFGLLVLTLVAWFTPQRAWSFIGRVAAPIATRVVSDEAQARKERISRLGGGRAGFADPEGLLRRLFAGYVEDTLQLLRVHAPWSWRPEVRLVGEEHLRAALEEGKGAVLWTGFFTFRNVVAKMALHRAGYACSHLIHPRHGFSSTRFGMRLLNPIRTRAEARYLREHVPLALDGSQGALRLLRRRLLKGGLVSLTARESGSRPVMVPLLDGSILLATGGPDLAYATGAPLLPIFAVRNAEGVFEVRIEPPLEADRTLPRRAWSEAVTRAYAERLDAYVAAYPDQWCGWEHH